MKAKIGRQMTGTQGPVERRRRMSATNGLFAAAAIVLALGLSAWSRHDARPQDDPAEVTVPSCAIDDDHEASGADHDGDRDRRESERDHGSAADDERVACVSAATPAVVSESSRPVLLGVGAAGALAAGVVVVRRQSRPRRPGRGPAAGAQRSS